MGVDVPYQANGPAPANSRLGPSTSTDDLYLQLGLKLDGLSARLPWNQTLHYLLREIFSPAEAELMISMPYGTSTLETLSKTTRLEEPDLVTLLEGLCSKGLIMDLWIDGTYRYIPSPLVAGMHEIIRALEVESHATDYSSKLLYQYFDTGFYYKANSNPEMQVSVFRILPYVEALGQGIQCLEHEHPSWIVDSADKCAVGSCSFKNVRTPVSSKKCQAPKEACVFFDHIADYQVRHNLARYISKAELKEMLVSSKENGLLLAVENVRQKVSFMCQCCSCCCFLLDGLKRYGLSTSTLASGYVAQIDEEMCDGCSRCVDACPVNAIQMVPLYLGPQEEYSETTARIDAQKCLGCGICGILCPTGALSLSRHKKRIVRPDTTFQRIMLQCLERGTLQNQLFDSPDNLAHKALRYILGTFFKFLPINRALMSTAIRKLFLTALETAFTAANKDELLQI